MTGLATRMAQPLTGFAKGILIPDSHYSISQGQDGLTRFSCPHADEMPGGVFQMVGCEDNQLAMDQPVAGEGLAKERDTEPRLRRG